MISTRDCRSLIKLLAVNFLPSDGDAVHFSRMRVAGKIQTWLQAATGLVYPEICQLCKTERASLKDGLVCGKCWTQVRFIRRPFCERCGLPFEGDLTTSFRCTNCHELKLYFSSARSAVVAKTVVLEAIHRFKYSRAVWFEYFLADLLVREAGPVLANHSWDFIVPVPLHSLKLREREFNQAEVVALHLSRATEIPLDNRLLRRIRPTATQTVLNREQRASNTKNAFIVNKSKNIKNKRIIVVDDVFTTGATTNACAQVLQKAGAAEVCVWTVARGL